MNNKRRCVVGDYVKITRRKWQHEFQLGEIVELIEYCPEGGTDQNWRAAGDKGRCYYLSEDEFIVEGEAYPHAPFQAGDYVQVVGENKRIYGDAWRYGGIFKVIDVSDIDMSVALVEDNERFGYENLAKLKTSLEGGEEVVRGDAVVLLHGPKGGKIGTVRDRHDTHVSLEELEFDNYTFGVGLLAKVPRPDLLPDKPKVEPLPKVQWWDCSVLHEDTISAGLASDMPEDPCELEGVWDVGGVGYYIDLDVRQDRYRRYPVHGDSRTGRTVIFFYRELLDAIEKEGWKHIEKVNSTIGNSEFKKPDRRKLSTISTPVDPYDLG